MCMLDLQPLGWILVWKSPHLSGTGPSLILKVQIHYGQLQDTVQSDLTNPLVSADATVHLHTRHETGLKCYLRTIGHSKYILKAKLIVLSFKMCVSVIGYLVSVWQPQWTDRLPKHELAIWNNGLSTRRVRDWVTRRPVVFPGVTFCCQLT